MPALGNATAGSYAVGYFAAFVARIIGAEESAGAGTHAIATRLPFGTDSALRATAVAAAILACAIGGALADVGIRIAVGTGRTIAVAAAFPIATLAIADDRAPWAAELFAVASSEAAGIVAAFRDAGWAAIGAAFDLSGWAAAFAVAPGLFAWASGRFRGARRAPSGFGVAGRDQGDRSPNAEQSFQELPSIAGRGQSASEGIESSIVHAVSLVRIGWLSCCASLHGETMPPLQPSPKMLVASLPC